MSAGSHRRCCCNNPTGCKTCENCCIPRTVIVTISGVAPCYDADPDIQYNNNLIASIVNGTHVLVGVGAWSKDIALVGLYGQTTTDPILRISASCGTDKIFVDARTYHVDTYSNPFGTGRFLLSSIQTSVPCVPPYEGDTSSISCGYDYGEGYGGTASINWDTSHCGWYCDIEGTCKCASCLQVSCGECSHSADESCEGCLDYGTCFAIDGYNDHDLGGCENCIDYTDAAWDGTFSSKLHPELCTWAASGDFTSIDDKMFLPNQTKIWWDGTNWYIEVWCDGDMIWSGSRTAVSPIGEYTRTGGCDTTGTLSIIECEGGI
jgi:hypothetical protein